METRLLYNVSWAHFQKFTKRRKIQNNLEFLRQNTNPNVLRSMLQIIAIVGTVWVYLQNTDLFILFLYKFY